MKHKHYYDDKIVFVKRTLIKLYRLYTIKITQLKYITIVFLKTSGRQIIYTLLVQTLINILNNVTILMKHICIK